MTLGKARTALKSDNSLKFWSSYVDRLYDTLSLLSVRDKLQNEMGWQAGFDLWVQWTLSLKQNKGCIYLIGNGASASIAAHLAADMAKNGGIRTTLLSDSAMVTALANDIDFSSIFSEPITWWMNQADMLVCISSSGNSLNIINAINAAKEKKGIIITLSAMGEENHIRKMGDLNIFIPAKTYGLAESGHTAILHYWMDLIESFG